MNKTPIIAAGIAALTIGGCSAERERYEVAKTVPVLEVEMRQGDTDISLLERELHGSTRSSPFYQLSRVTSPREFVLNGDTDKSRGVVDGHILHVFDYATIIAALNPSRSENNGRLAPGTRSNVLDFDGDGLYAGRQARPTGETMTFRGSYAPRSKEGPRQQQKSFTYGSRTYTVR